MNSKEEFDLLIKSIKSGALKKGMKITNKEIAERLGYTPQYFNTLTGNSGKVTSDHINTVKAIFKEELAQIAAPPGDQLNPERALMFALLEDYVSWKAAATGQAYDDIKNQIKKRGKQILDGLDSWLPGN